MYLNGHILLQIKGLGNVVLTQGALRKELGERGERIQLENQKVSNVYGFYRGLN